jgi:hypothetical protein
MDELGGLIPACAPEELSNIRYCFRGAQQYQVSFQKSSAISGMISEELSNPRLVSAELSNIKHSFRAKQSQV